MRFTLGSDPELFLCTMDNRMIASIGLIGGTKKNPMPTMLGEGYTVQEDNVAVEFNIPPASNPHAFAESLTHMLHLLAKSVRRKGLNLMIVPSANFDEKELSKKGAEQFGCDADFNAWTGDQNPKPTCDDPSLRSAGGHVHVGSELAKEIPMPLIRTFDLFLGAPATTFDKDMKRRKLYGKAGAFRWTDFGCEYRVLSNAWLVTPDRMHWVWHQVDRAHEFLNATPPAEREEVLMDYEEIITAAVNNGDTDALRVLQEKFNILQGVPV